jgi:hypothetical protein
MEILTATLIVSLLDPIRALITFGCIFVLRKSYGVAVAAAASALVCESILTFGQVPRVWGQDLLAGLIASLIQAVVLVLLSRAFNGGVPFKAAKAGKVPIQPSLGSRAGGGCGGGEAAPLLERRRRLERRAVALKLDHSEPQEVYPA